MSTLQLLKKVLITTAPVMSGYIFLGIGFGVLLAKAGYGVPWAVLMCIVVYGGTMQYVGVSLIASSASIVSAAITTLAVNARHIFYGISMLPLYKGAGLKKPYLIFSLTDETYALTVDNLVPRGVDPHLFRFLVALFDHSYWIIGGALGALIGTKLSFNSTGIDFSMTALFITVFVKQWMTSHDHFPALTGLICTLGCLLIFGPENFLIPSMVSITLVLTLARKRIEASLAQDGTEKKETRNG
ncbi:MAG: AzlC family ABC transporter permease [Lachnospiraceae bacterium]|nr:AzlC family ABC transporter permease [Lachnospiraceae bacterium]